MEKCEEMMKRLRKENNACFRVHRAGIISPAIRVRDIFNLHMHDARASIASLGFSEKREREHVYARGGGCVCLTVGTKRREEDISPKVSTTRISIRNRKAARRIR